MESSFLPKTINSFGISNPIKDHNFLTCTKDLCVVLSDNSTENESLPPQLTTPVLEENDIWNPFVLWNELIQANQTAKKCCDAWATFDRLCTAMPELLDSPDSTKILVDTIQAVNTARRYQKKWHEWEWICEEQSRKKDPVRALEALLVPVEIRLSIPDDSPVWEFLDESLKKAIPFQDKNMEMMPEPLNKAHKRAARP